VTRLHVLAVVLGLGLAPAGAHHSIAVFDGRRVVKIEGTVAEFRWVNPHAFFEVDGMDAVENRAGRWNVEMQAPNTMSGEGWGRDTLAAGSKVIVFANPLRNPDAAGRLRALYVGIILPDGRTLGRTATDNR
jgi:hypothetical protein